VKSPREAELSDEDSVDIFFSFDVTTLAYLVEQRHSPGNEFSLARLPSSSRNQTALEQFRAILSEHARTFLRNPVSYGYMLIVLLSLLLVIRLQPLQELAVDRITSMIPPELTITKPAPKPEPAPEAEQKEPEAPPEPKSEPIKSEPEPVPEPEASARQPLKLQRTPVPPAETLMTEVPRQRLRQVPESRPEVGVVKRETPEVPGLLVEAPPTRTSEMDSVQFRTPAQTPTTAPNTPPARALGRFDSKKAVPAVEQDLRVEGISTPEHRSTVVTPVETPVTSVPKRNQRTDQRLEVVSEKRSQTLAPLDQPARQLGIRVPKGTSGLLTRDEVQGTWQRLENVGPVAHLNALCFGREPEEYVYHENFRLRCRDNQIIEGWLRKE